MTTASVRVVVFQHGLGALDYAVPPGLDLGPGDAVTVPLGPRTITGVVWDAGRLHGRDVEPKRLRPVAARLDLPPIAEPLRRLCEWVADYYVAPLAGVIRMVWPSVAFLGDRETTEYRAGGDAPTRLTPERARALEKLADRQGSVRDLTRIAGVSDAVIRGLVKAGTLLPVVVGADRPIAVPDPGFAPPLLEAAQAAAAGSIADAVTAGGFAPFLLEGVTGSGKTEVYFEAVAAALRSGGQALVLVPEIALTAPWLARFAARFGCAPVSWHSDLKASERRAAWSAIADGRARVVVGARSALFLPFKDLRVTIVDEAHETSFKQEEGVHYHARDVAVMRAREEAATVVLATATPAIETQVQAARGTYRHLLLPARFGGARMPDIAAVDLRRFPPARGHWLSPPLVAAVTATLEKGEQALLFLNRRGYAPLTLCRTCGERIQCPNCTAWMVEHRLSRRLACHHCGHVTPVPPACPACGDADSLVACGPGVERIAEEVGRLWPAAHVALVTSDTINSPARAAALVAAVEAREIDVLIGTQMVTKGYHFPELTLVGVVDADLGLSGGDLRAGERTFQQVAQVAGRAGRGAKPGRVLIQTHQPQARVMQALVAGDPRAFYAAETETRRDLGLPPFGRLAAIIVSSEDAGAALAAARAIGAAAPAAEGLSVLGPAAAPLAMLRGRHRQRLLVQATRTLALQRILRDWLGSVPVPGNVRVVVDVDPYSFV
ncbi:primosomal protein N' [Polymorphobacter fuscus]|uniref:Replication restart protein PriA n=1 Tax=Sandarakinorhabdus fusca TaxID=1439888 RepID=A0A7C9GQ64_9SPHN|nr:primosomal protein N' [Polymorphobacter fuscus]KAB7647962.1 primosomal protein N' [Polymorphobacter fuscus]MQT17290.1 primosomal protein N' [Polymorphobacter fuscus]NJC08712.1 primosomal protein N' (replication factor Y) [Polymorphobacter fuscus]